MWIKLKDSTDVMPLIVELSDNEGSDLIEAGYAVSSLPSQGVIDMISRIKPDYCYVEMKEPVAEDNTCYKRNYIYHVPIHQAKRWQEAGWCDVTGSPPLHEQELSSRLTSDNRVIILPFLGEFGHKIMSHIRLVHFHPADEKIVCCRPGEEVLYPSATGFYYNWDFPLHDTEIIGSYRQHIEWPHIADKFRNYKLIPAGNLSPEAEIHAIYPNTRIPFKPTLRGFKVDICLGVRVREFESQRNWEHWQQLADVITKSGHTFAVIGRHATSLNLVGQKYHSGDFSDTDAAIELLQNCKLYIGTDTGISHLASTVGSNMLLFRCQDGSRDLTSRMTAVNEGRIELVRDGWTTPNKTTDRALAILSSYN